MRTRIGSFAALVVLAAVIFFVLGAQRATAQDGFDTSGWDYWTTQTYDPNFPAPLGVAGSGFTAINFRQCANGRPVPAGGACDWINSILQQNNSTYYEGMSTLQRVTITGLSGNEHTLALSVQAAKGGIHAYDFITSWEQAVAAAAVVTGGNPNIFPDLTNNSIACANNPPGNSNTGPQAVCLEVRNPTTGICATGTISDDMGILLGDNVAEKVATYESHFGDRTVKVCMPKDIGGITDVQLTFTSYSADADTSYANYTLTWKTTNIANPSTTGRVLIEFAGHIAVGEGPPGFGYGSGKGASSISGGPYHFKLGNFDGASTGSQDNQLKGADILIIPGQITICKVVDNVTNDPTNFNFTTNFDGNYALNETTNGTGCRTKGELAPGTNYTATEGTNANYDLVSISCDDGNSTNPSTVDLATRTATIKLEQAENVTCTFTNRLKTGTVIIRKKSVGGVGQFNFTSLQNLPSPAVDGAFNLTTTTENVEVSSTFNNVLANQAYLVTESGVGGSGPALSDWGTTVSCSVTTDAGAQGDTTFSTSDGNRQANITNLGPGDTISCLFTNTKKAKVRVEKVCLPGSDTTTVFTYDLQRGSDTATHPTLTCNAGASDFVPLTAAAADFTSWKITEQAKTGWTLTNITCTTDSGLTIGTAVTDGDFDAGDTQVSLNLDPGDNILCTFTNTKDATLAIQKQTIGGTAVFSFTGSGAGVPASFTRDTGTANPTTAAAFAITGAQLGDKFVQETVLAGWDLTNITCTASGATIVIGRGGSGSFNNGGGDGFDAGDDTVKVSVAAGSSPTCTFVNTKRGSLKIIKDAIPNDAQDFAYTGSGSGVSASFSLDDDSGASGEDSALNNNITFNNLVAGAAYRVSETQPVAGWDLTGISCNNAAAVIGRISDGNFVNGGSDGFDAGDNVVDVSSLPAGANIECTFTNTKQGSLAIQKQTIGGTAEFSFTGTGAGVPANFTRNTDPNNPTTAAAFPISSSQFGDKFVQETVLAGWTLTNISCTANGATIVIGRGGSGSFADGGSAGYEQGDDTVKVSVAAGNTPSCTFVNTKNASLKVDKQTIGGTAEFSFTGSGAGVPANFTRNTGTANPTNSTAFTILGTELGDKFVQETVLAGWTLTNISCTANGATIVIGRGGSGSFNNGGGDGFDAGDDTVKVTVAAGNTPSCTFENTKDATITVEKNAIPDDAQDFSYTVSGEGWGNFALDDDSDGTLPNMRTFTFSGANATGTKTVAEGAVAGWTLTNLVCSKGTTNLGSGQASIDLLPGDAVTCTFTNTKDATITVVKNAIPDDAQDFSYTVSGAGWSNFALDDDSDGTLPNTQTFTFSGANATGTKTVAEGAVAGWTLTNLVCSKGTTNLGSGQASIDLLPGDAVTCTFTNTKDATITVVKNAIPDDAQDFSYTVSGAGWSNFALDDDSDGTLPNTQTFTFSGANATGTKTVAEGAVAGWTLTNLVCSKGTTNLGSGQASIDLLPGDAVTCTFTNTKNATVKIVKNTIGGNDTFTYATGGSLSGQGSPAVPASLQITTTAGTGESSMFAFSGLPTGGSSLTFNEEEQAGWQRTDLACTGDSEATTDTTTGLASLNVNPGETIVCTYTNLKIADMPVRKYVGGNLVSCETGPGTTPFNTFVPPCTDPVMGNLTPGGVGIFTLNLYLDNPNTSPADESDPSGTPAVGNLPFPPHIDPQVPALTKATLCETVPTGWKIPTTGDVLLKPTPQPTGWVQAVTVFAHPSISRTACFTFTIPADTDTFEIDINNTPLSKLIVEKQTNPANSTAQFTFTPTSWNSGNTFQLADNGEKDSGFIPGGSYSVAETIPAGWTLSNISCTATIPAGGAGTSSFTYTSTGDDTFQVGDTTANITLQPGATVRCVFTNTQDGKVTIAKISQGDVGTFKYTSTGSLPSPADASGNFDITTVVINNAMSKVFTFANLAANGKEVTVTEVDPSVDPGNGWMFVNLQCTTDTGTSVNVTTRTATIHVDPGDNITCTFTNARPIASCTFTQGGWGTVAHGGNPGAIRDQWFDAVYPNGLVVGDGVFNNLAPWGMLFPNSNFVAGYLPAGSTARALTQDWNSTTIPPDKKNAGGVFGGQVTSLRLAVDFSDYLAGSNQGPLNPWFGKDILGNLIYTGTGPFSGQSIRQILAAAETALSGAGGNISQLNSLVGAINEGFDGCKLNDWAQQNFARPLQ